MAVGSFDPNSSNHTSEIKPADIAELLGAAQRLNEHSTAASVDSEWAAKLGLNQLAIARLAPLASHGPGKGGADWSAAAIELPDADIVSLIRLFTLAEPQLPGWEAGAKSPVVPLAAILRKRDGYPDGLTKWIKTNTTNRFLPYGSLMDRL